MPITIDLSQAKHLKKIDELKCEIASLSEDLAKVRDQCKRARAEKDETEEEFEQKYRKLKKEKYSE